MKKSKVIAREFIILMGCFGLGLIAFGGTFIYNGIAQTQVSKLERNLQDILNNGEHGQIKAKLTNQNRLWEFWKDKTSYNKSFKIFWLRLQEQYQNKMISYRWDSWDDDFRDELRVEFGFQTYTDLEQFIRDNSIENSEDGAGKKLIAEIEELEEKVQSERGKIMTLENQGAFAFITFLFLLIPAFPLRYLYYAIMWSIHTLKSNV
jgi:hypothetical protein